ncbi:reactive intermediate/imine deaminase [Winogradskyella sp. PC-19]|jgi:2-iminobutanoate/2-iminopropanoate deaminase|uniref:Rid family detoxifying hydrolase n=1 Tax=unclassified Winogradskyella TaxID=2615021 RepID=UPI000B3C100F|nr:MULTISPECIES: Rid family detoxifying hydrolase [unclassified Winogradskyella]ARV09125.1 reactive intermediate/imine deaminase [Winogradskyella sp. PC-19]RZN83935.1 MAG: RidA family protein [Winogradskyella sp.]
MSKYLSISCFLFVIFFQSCNNSNSEIIFHKSHEPTRANVPFSDAVETGNLLFLTGQIGKDHKIGKLVTGGVTAETKQVVLNIQDVLKQHNLTLDNVVKCTVILKDINDFKAFNTVYTQYFTKKPARTTFAAGGLAGGASIEIEVVAAKY